MQMMKPRTEYSRAEYVSDAVVHASGLVIVLVSVPVLITLAAVLRGDSAAMVGTSVYGVTLIAMILCSALYNIVGTGRWGWLLKRLDHSAIYAKIAGTYTPFALLTGQGGWLLAGLWTAAFAGIGLKLVSPYRFRMIGISLYLLMGWAGVIVGSPFIGALSAPVLTLIVIGGLIYTAGVLLYLFERLPFHNTAWHVMVLAASMVFYAAVMVQLVKSVA